MKKTPVTFQNFKNIKKFPVTPQMSVEEIKRSIEKEIQIPSSDMIFKEEEGNELILQDNDIFAQKVKLVPGLVIKVLKSSTKPLALPSVTRNSELYLPDSCLIPSPDDKKEIVRIRKELFLGNEFSEEKILFAFESAVYNIDLAIEYLLASTNPNKKETQTPDRKSIAASIRSSHQSKIESFHSSRKQKSDVDKKFDSTIIQQLCKETNQNEMYVKQIYYSFNEGNISQEELIVKVRDHLIEHPQ